MLSRDIFDGMEPSLMLCCTAVTVGNQVLGVLYPGLNVGNPRLCPCRLVRSRSGFGQRVGNPAIKIVKWFLHRGQLAQEYNLSAIFTSTERCFPTLPLDHERQ